MFFISPSSSLLLLHYYFIPPPSSCPSWMESLLFLLLGQFWTLLPTCQENGVFPVSVIQVCHFLNAWKWSFWGEIAIFRPNPNGKSNKKLSKKRQSKGFHPWGQLVPNWLPTDDIDISQCFPCLHPSFPLLSTQALTLQEPWAQSTNCCSLTLKSSPTWREREV